MIKILCLLFLSVKSFATSIYHPHVTIAAKTVNKGSFSYQLAPGASVTHNVFINSLSYGVFESLEIGTIPIFYFDKIHRYNYNFKYNFYKSNNLSLSVGFSSISFDLSKEYSIVDNPPTDYKINFISFSMNYDIPKTTYYTGFTFNRVSSYANKSAFLNTYEVNDEWAIDIGKKINNKYSLTLGVGEHKIGITRPKNSFGVGASLILTKKFSYFSNLAIGIQYLTDEKSALYLFSADL